jgi:crossover junction endodeoxyribonuclease RuvC
MLIFGIDPGSRITGFGVIEYTGKEYKLRESGLIRLSPRLPFVQRLQKLYLDLTQKLQENTPDEIAVEDIFCRENVKTALTIGHARGVILLAASQMGVPIAEYSPSEVKMAVVGSGQASKGQVQFMVKTILGLPEPIPADAADALAVALCHAHKVEL